MAQALELLDTLIDDLRHAISKDDWEEVNVLTTRVIDRVEPVMTELAEGGISPAVVEEKLGTLQHLCEEAKQGVKGHKADLLNTLKGLDRTRTAARTYADVSVRRPG